MIEPEIAFADLADEMELAEAMVIKYHRLRSGDLPGRDGFLQRVFDKTLLERLNALVNSEFCPRFLHGAVALLSKHNDEFQYPRPLGAATCRPNTSAS